MISVQITAQNTFEKYYGYANTSDFCNAMLATDDGYILFGTSNHEELGYQAYVVRTDANGNELWHQDYGTDENGYGIDIVSSPDGHFYIVGHTIEDVWTIFVKKINGEDGSILWENSYPSVVQKTVAKATIAIDGSSLLLAGTENGLYGFTMLLDENGTKQWTRTYDSGVTDRVYSVKATSSNAYILTGYTLDSELALLKIWKVSQYGELLTDKVVEIVNSNSSPYYVGIYDVHTVSNGDMFLVGGGSNESDVEIGPSFIAYTDSTGNILWTDINEEGSYPYKSRFYNRLIPISDTEIIAVGTITEDDNPNLMISKINNVGEIQTQITDFNNGKDEARAIAETDDGYAVAGYSSGLNENGYDFFLVNVDEALNVDTPYSYGTFGPQHGTRSLTFVNKPDGGYFMSSVNYIGAEQQFSLAFLDIDAEGNEVNNFFIDNQDWTACYDVILSNDGNYIVYNNSLFGEGDIIKMNESGNIIWNTSLDNVNTSFNRSLVATEDGYYVGSRGLQDELYWCKLSESGTILWEKNHKFEDVSGGWVYDILENTEGDLIISGRVNGVADPNTNLIGTRPYVAKSDDNGNILWESVYYVSDSTFYGRVFQTIQASDGNYITVGAKLNAAGIFEMHIMKVSDTDGNIEWDKTFLSEGNAIGSYDLQELSNGDFLFLSNAETESEAGSGRDGVLLRTDANGNEIWTKFYSTNGYSPVFHQMFITEDGGYVLGGEVSLNNATVNFLMKTDEEGNFISTNIEDLVFYTTTMQVAPNPNQGAFNLYFENEIIGDDWELKVTDLTGRTFYQQLIHKTEKVYEQSFQIPLPTGIYICEVRNGENVFIQKMMVR